MSRKKEELSKEKKVMEEQGEIVPTFKTMAARICSPVCIDMVISILATTGQSPSFQTCT
jgi:hypothetical protein